MKKCVFCNLDKNKIENTIIEETNNFYITPTVGSLVDGYLLVISKKHINAMAELSENEKKEYLDIIEKFRNRFKKVYNKYPIIFEHGTSIMQKNISASSVIHAHTHIINHNYKNEEQILKKLNFQMISKDFNIEKNKSYIFYINQNNTNYITYNFKPISQMMRTFIAKDLNIEEKYDWKSYTFTENIIKTIENFK